MDNMPRRFTLCMRRSLKDHVRAIEAKYHSLIRDTITQQVSFEPTTKRAIGSHSSGP